MTKRKIKPPSEAVIQAQIATDPDDSDVTPDEAAQAKPFAKTFPKLGESIRRARGRPALEKPRQHVSLRLDPDVLATFRKTGKGWQGRINEALRKVAGL